MSGGADTLNRAYAARTIGKSDDFVVSILTELPGIGFEEMLHQFGRMFRKGRFDAIEHLRYTTFWSRHREEGEVVASVLKRECEVDALASKEFKESINAARAAIAEAANDDRIAVILGQLGFHSSIDAFSEAAEIEEVDAAERLAATAYWSRNFAENRIAGAAKTKVVMKAASDAFAEGKSDDELADILGDLPGQFVHSAKAFSEICSVSLSEARLRLLVTPQWTRRLPGVVRYSREGVKLRARRRAAWRDWPSGAEVGPPYV